MNNRTFIEAALKSPFYKKMLKGRNLNDWSSIPFTKKDDLRNTDSFDLLGVPIDQIATYHETSGTTGTPSPSWYSHKDLEQEVAVVLNSTIQLHKEDIVLNRFPFAMAVSSFIVYWACQKIGAAHIGADKASFVTPHKRIVEIITRTNPTILAMLPSEAEKIYQAAIEMSVPFPKQAYVPYYLRGSWFLQKGRSILKKYGVFLFICYSAVQRQVEYR